MEIILGVASELAGEGGGGLEAPSIFFFFSVSNKVIKNANNLLIATIF